MYIIPIRFHFRIISLKQHPLIKCTHYSFEMFQQYDLIPMNAPKIMVVIVII